MREVIEILGLWLLTLLRIWIPIFHYRIFAGVVWVVISLAYLLSIQYARWKVMKSRYPTDYSLAREAGLRRDTFLPCLLFLLPFLLFFSILIGGISTQGGHLAGCRHLPLRYLLYLFWAIFQQYLLQGIVGVRLQSLGKSRMLTSLLTALLFASVHIPNPTLTAVTFIGGWIISYAFLTYPNLLAVAIGHALIATSMKCFLPKTILPNMYVGIFYLYPPPK